MVHGGHSGFLTLVIDGVDDAVVADADLPSDWTTAPLLGTASAWIIGQLTKSSPDSFLHL